MPGRPVVGPQDHGHGVPADQPPDAPLHLLVAREERLLLRADGVDVARLGQRRQADVQLAGTLEQLVEQEAGALVAFLAVDLVQRIQPLLRLGRVDVGQLVLELVEVHRFGWFSGAWSGTAVSGPRATSRLQVSRSARGTSRICGRLGPKTWIRVRDTPLALTRRIGAQ